MRMKIIFAAREKPSASKSAGRLDGTTEATVEPGMAASGVLPSADITAPLPVLLLRAMTGAGAAGLFQSVAAGGAPAVASCSRCALPPARRMKKRIANTATSASSA